MKIYITHENKHWGGYALYKIQAANLHTGKTKRTTLVYLYILYTYRSTVIKTAFLQITKMYASTRVIIDLHMIQFVGQVITGYMCTVEYIMSEPDLSPNNVFMFDCLNIHYS